VLVGPVEADDRHGSLHLEQHEVVVVHVELPGRSAARGGDGRRSSTTTLRRQRRA
jgi:hypothetical protein